MLRLGSWTLLCIHWPKRANDTVVTVVLYANPMEYCTLCRDVELLAIAYKIKRSCDLANCMCVNSKHALPTVIEPVKDCNI